MTAAYERDREHSIDLVDCVLAKRSEICKKPICSGGFVRIDLDREFIIPFKEFKQTNKK